MVSLSSVGHAGFSVNPAVDRTLALFGVGREEWNAYQQVKRDYAQETGVDFGATGTLRSMSQTLFLPGNGGTAVKNGITYNPVVNGKPTTRPEVDEASLAQRLRGRLDDLGSRDEAWVRKTYSLGESKEDQSFARRVAEDYGHMVQVVERLLKVLLPEENSATSLLDVRA